MQRIWSHKHCADEREGGDTKLELWGVDDPVLHEPFVHPECVHCGRWEGHACGCRSRPKIWERAHGRIFRHLPTVEGAED